MKTNPTNITGQIPPRRMVRAANPRRSKGGAMLMAACLAVLALALNATAANVTMTASDGFGAHSFDSSGSWDSHAAPTAGNNYFTAAYIVRSPNSGSSSITFAGDSLTISPGGALYSKLNPLTITVNNLTNSARVCNAQGGTTTLLGTMFVPTSGGAMDTGSGNSSATDNRTISNGMTISGSGNLTNLTTDANWPTLWPAAQGTVIYTGNNTAFTGPQIVMNNTVVQVSSQANLGGNPASFNPAQLQLSNGHLQPTASFALTNSNSGITIGANNGWFDIASGIILTNAEALAGSGTLTLTNTGTLVHSGVATNFTGTISVGGGTLVLAAGGSLAGSNTISVVGAGTFDVTAAGITLTNGQTLAGNGTVNGTVTAGTGSTISPGGAGVAGTIAIGDLTLSGGATLLCDFLATNDVIAVSGNLSPSGVTTIKIANIPAVGTYTVVSVAGTLGGATNNFQLSVLKTRSRTFALAYDTGSTPKRILLQVGPGQAANLVWRGDMVSGITNFWDINTTSNWLNGANSDVYFDGDTNNFTNFGATNQPVVNVTVNPGAVFFNSSSNYTLTGSGAIAGVTTVSKGGTGTVTITTTNTYGGGTIITGGVFKVGYTNAVAGALGSPSGATALATISGAGTLDLNGAPIDAVYTNVVQINGNGSSATQGAIDNSAGGLTSGGGDVGIGTLALLGDSTISAASNWQIGNTGQGIIGNGYTLTKIGGTSLYNYLYLRHAAASALGKFVIAGGGVLFWDHGSDAIGATATIVLTNGGWIDTWSPLTYNAGLTFASPIIVSDPVNGGMIVNFRNVGWNQAPPDTYNGSVTLNGSLTISNVSYYNGAPNNIDTFGKVTMNGNISGTGGVNAIGGTANFLSSGSVFYGGNRVIFNGNNSYNGPTLVTNLIQLQTTTANQSGGAYDVEEAGTLDVAVVSGKPTIPMSSLVLGSYANLGGGNLSFARLTSMPSSPVIYATNLTLKGSGSGYDINGILPPVAGYSVGQFPLVKYVGSIGGNGFPALALGTVPRGVTASLTNNTANKTIDLKVNTTGIVWRGTNSSSWDITTASWYNPVSATMGTYQDGDSVVFDDTATNFNVVIVRADQPGGITVNSINDYVFSTSSGGISGSAVLVKNGSGTLTISCTNNTFTGGTFIIGGTIKLADLNFVYPYGSGALNNNLGTVSVANGGTLDINAVQVPNYQTYGPDGYNVFISGSGVGGNGALVNNNTNANDLADPGYVTLTGDATVGGIGDVNIRMGISPQLSSQSSDYTLTKVGPGQFRIRYVTAVSPNFGAVNIREGRVSYESSSALGFGDASKPITVSSNGGFAWGTAATSCMRTLICSNASTIYGVNITNNVFAGPVTLAGGIVNLNANFYNGMIFSNVISGAGGINLQYQSLATFAAANTYSGFTTVNNCNTAGGGNNGSVLRLVGNGSIDHSANITLQGITALQAYPGALDVSGRTDGTLTLVNNQTLRGYNGSYVRGNVVATSGTSIIPGGPTNIQYMTISNNLTLQSGSTVAMDVSLDGGATNDLIRVVGAMTYGGTLQITNIGATALTNGASFKLFDNGSFSGNFATVSGSPGETWSFNPAAGIATVSGLTTPRPIITHIGVSGTTLTINATNGVANGQFVLLESTNLTLPRAQWTPVLTNVFDSNGDLNLSTNIVNLGIALEFYILKY